MIVDNSKREKNREAQHAFHERMRLAGIKHYGSVCIKCGDTRDEVLIVSATDDATKKRNSIQFYYWLKRRGYPEGYAVFCRNCRARVSRA
jgi:hypothetical protein